MSRQNATITAEQFANMSTCECAQCLALRVPPPLPPAPAGTLDVVVTSAPERSPELPAEARERAAVALRNGRGGR